MQQIIDWLSKNWGWVIAGFSLLFEISPIKISPISAFCKWIGNKLTSDIKEDIEKINERIDEQQEAIDMSRISNIRSLVLDFANSCRNGRRHSKEEYKHIMNENNDYQELVKKYKITNDVYKEDYNFVLEKYRECLHDNSFLA